jgi:hypothetical protein
MRTAVYGYCSRSARRWICGFALIENCGKDNK